MTKEEIIQNFNPNQPGLTDATLYGLPFTADQSEIIIIPVPWEVTVSYGDGASIGPEAVFEASFQVDLLHQEFPDLWKLGIYMDKEIPNWKERSDLYKKMAKPIIKALEDGQIINETNPLKSHLKKINQATKEFNEELKSKVLYWLNENKLVGLLGGDHSTPLGYYQALASKYDEFGILHLDAHMDLRNAYEGFNHSHASIMNNALKIPQIKKIVQVGIRDFCEEEVKTVKNSNDRVKVFTDLDLRKAEFNGESWKVQCEKIISVLPDKVHISLDIDALYQWYCPNTGTPVPGGLSFDQITYLLISLANSKKEIIGFDLVEVSPGEDDWDGNVGARMLFYLCGVIAKSKGLNVGSPIVFD